MARINLRAWREERAAQRQKQFLVNVALSAFIAAAVAFVIGLYFDTQTDRQNIRNNFLNTEIAKLDAQLESIRQLKIDRGRLMDRLGAIQDLQSSRSLIVRSFDELVKVPPDGVYYLSLSRVSDVISLKGRAEKSRDVSELMRNIYASDWFGEPNLTTVANDSNMKAFDLTVPVLKINTTEAQ